MMMEATVESPRRLYKSRQNRIIDGICGGISEYFAIDPTIVRILWVLITLMGGAGFLLYIAGMIIIPTNPEHSVSTASGAVQRVPLDRKRFWGVLLILVGAFILLVNVGWLAEHRWWLFSREFIFPALLILVGGMLIYTYSKRKQTMTNSPFPSTGENPIPPLAGTPGVFPQPVKELRRSLRNRKLFGVCGGIADYFNIDPTIVRILFIALVLASFGWGILLYIILGLLMPEERMTSTTTVTP